MIRGDMCVTQHPTHLHDALRYVPRVDSALPKVIVHVISPLSTHSAVFSDGDQEQPCKPCTHHKKIWHFVLQEPH